jgi:hypothetical protein
MKNQNGLKCFVCLILLTTLALTGCNLPAPETPAPDLGATAAAQTVAVQLTQPVGETAAPATSGPDVTDTPAPSATPQTPTVTLTPTQDPDCNRAEFVSDVTVNDGTQFEPGETFTKTWRLRNSGSCDWKTEYALAFKDGDKMGASDTVPLPGVVPAGSEVDLSVELTAPEVSGSYQGNWMLQNDESELFGIGEDADEFFWVQIVVTTSVDDLDLGVPTWTDTFNSDANWYMVNTDNTRFNVEDGHLVMKSINAGGLEEWGLSGRPALEDFYFEIRVTTGEKCEGRDRYGVIVRAEDPQHGYVYGFSCNGQYRLYIWDDGEFTGLKNWTTATEIQSGPEQTNRLGIQFDGTEIKLYANGKLLTTVSDDTFSKGRFGLFIASGPSANFEVYVEEAAYWLLD